MHVQLAVNKDHTLSDLFKEMAVPEEYGMEFKVLTGCYGNHQPCLVHGLTDTNEPIPHCFCYKIIQRYRYALLPVRCIVSYPSLMTPVRCTACRRRVRSWGKVVKRTEACERHIPP